MPWLYVRRQIAQRWCVPPWVVDYVLEEAPAEVALELQIMRIEGQERKNASD